MHILFELVLLFNAQSLQDEYFMYNYYFPFEAKKLNSVQERVRTNGTKSAASGENGIDMPDGMYEDDVVDGPCGEPENMHNGAQGRAPSHFSFPCTQLNSFTKAMNDLSGSKTNFSRN